MLKIDIKIVNSKCLSYKATPSAMKMWSYKKGEQLRVPF